MHHSFIHSFIISCSFLFIHNSFLGLHVQCCCCYSSPALRSECLYMLHHYFSYPGIQWAVPAGSWKCVLGLVSTHSFILLHTSNGSRYSSLLAPWISTDCVILYRYLLLPLVFRWEMLNTFRNRWRKEKKVKGQGQGYFIRHILNYTQYNQ